MLGSGNALPMSRRKAGGYGPDLNTLANAVSVANEADAVTGWSQFGLDLGSNVFESQGVVVSDGSYAFRAEVVDTPTSLWRIWIDMEAAPFNLQDGDKVRLRFDIRHTGTGTATAGIRVYLSTNIGGTDNLLATVIKSELTYRTVEIEYTHDGTYRYFGIREFNTSNDGGFYLDKFIPQIK